MKLLGYSTLNNAPVFGEAFLESDTHGFPLSEYFKMALIKNGTVCIPEYIADSLIHLWDDSKIITKLDEAFLDADLIPPGCGSISKSRVEYVIRKYYVKDPKGGLVATGENILRILKENPSEFGIRK